MRVQDHSRQVTSGVGIYGELANKVDQDNCHTDFKADQYLHFQ